MTPLVVREAAASDVPVLARLRRAWAEEDAGTPIDDPDFEANFAEWYAAERSRRLTWLAEADGVPVGMLNLVVFDRMVKPGRPRSQWGYVSNVFILAGHRDRGAGRKLVEAALRYAREHDFARVVLSPSERSVPFYRRAGFGDADSLLLHPLT
ncbi:MAG: GNAT family N-acetyltransferase [Micromonosporaceae bacterium]